MDNSKQNEEIKTGETDEEIKTPATDEIFGIDYGTSSCCLSQWKGDGQPLEVIKFPKFHNKRFPSYISYLPKYNQWVIGDLAESCLDKYPRTSFTNLKRFIGENIIMMEQDEEFTGEDILCNFFKILKSLIPELNPPRKMEGAVISVPYSFYEFQRAAVIHSAQSGGIPVLSLINDPEAILLAYCFEDRIEKYEENILILDMGEATLDISLFNVRQQKNYIVINCLNTLGSPGVGGESIDRLLLQKILEKNSISDGELWHKIIEKKEPVTGKLKKALKELKHTLSNKKEASLIDFQFIQGINTFQEITREEFNEAIGSILSTINEYLHQTLKEVNLTSDKIDKVLINGDSVRMPSIRNIIEKFFTNHLTRILFLENEFMISQGAAIYGALLKGKTTRFGLNPINPYAIGVELAGGIFDDIIIKGKRLPCSGKKAYQLKNSGATAFDINFYQGDKEMVSKNQPIALIEMEGLNPLTENDYIVININLDENCIGDLKIDVKNSNISWGRKLSLY